MKINDIIKGQVISIDLTHVLVKLENEQIAILHISEVSDYFVGDLEKIFEINKFYWFQIIEINLEKKRISLSWKKIVPRFLKNPFDFILQETNNGFKNLKKFVEGEINA